MSYRYKKAQNHAKKTPAAATPATQKQIQASSAGVSLHGCEAWQFVPLDTWFFRESRPLESVGGAQLTSQFPPPVRTLTLKGARSSSS